MTDNALVPLRFAPGISRDKTEYDNKGRWFDCNWVRFRAGQPEVMGGWEKVMLDTFDGHVRMMTTLSAYSEYVNGGYRQWLVIGTDEAFYISDEADLYQLLPYVAFNEPTNAVQTTNGSDIVRINDPDRPADLEIGDTIVLTVSSTVAGITAGTLSNTWTVVGLPSSTSFTIDVNQNANATVAAGGGDCTITYRAAIDRYHYWSQDNFGFYLVANLRDSAIFWYPNNFLTIPPTSDNMFPLTSIPAGSDVPSVSRIVAVSAEESHCIAFGCNPLGETFQDPMFVRWSDTESLANWTPSITNTAGGYRLSIGNEIIAIKETRTEILIWTDLALYSMRWVGNQYVFSFVLVGNNVSIISLNASCATNDFVAWMGLQQFFIYDGRIRPLDCPISDYIFTSLNQDQLDKIYAFTNNNFNEVGWLIPTGSSEEPDLAVFYNYKDNAWYYGEIDRTAWLDKGPSYPPVAAHSSNGSLYYQESGLDDGTSGSPAAISAYIESSPIEISEGGDGMSFMFVDRLIPDITFRNSEASEPTATMTLTMQDYPGAADATSQSTGSTVEQGTGVPVGQFTEQCWIRLRGRSLKFKCASNEVGVTWRLGAPRIGAMPDGYR